MDDLYRALYYNYLSPDPESYYGDWGLERKNVVFVRHSIARGEMLETIRYNVIENIIGHLNLGHQS